MKNTLLLHRIFRMQYPRFNNDTGLVAQLDRATAF